MADSTRLQLRVAPGAAQSGVVGRHGAGWKLRVTSAPERGKANEAVLRVLAAALDVPERSLSLVSGHASRDKVVELHGLDAEEAERRLERAR
jgi:uncharacterized protein YggU (UPF0235/DUF167 family)